MYSIWIHLYLASFSLLFSCGIGKQLIFLVANGSVQSIPSWEEAFWRVLMTNFHLCTGVLCILNHSQWKSRRFPILQATWMVGIENRGDFHFSPRKWPAVPKKNMWPLKFQDQKNFTPHSVQPCTTLSTKRISTPPSTACTARHATFKGIMSWKSNLGVSWSWQEDGYSYFIT